VTNHEIISLWGSRLQPINVIWLHGQSCSGDTVSLIGAGQPSFTDLLDGLLPETAGIRLVFHPTIMTTWGKSAFAVLDDAAQGKLDPFLLIFEGSVPNEKQAAKNGGYYCSVGQRNGVSVTANDILLELKDKAAATIAVGTCASFGGIVAGRPNPTGAKGVMDFLGKDYRSSLGLPVINVSGCPASGDNYIRALVYVTLLARGIVKGPPELDEHNRLKFLHDELAHHLCPRGGYFAISKYSYQFGDPYCMVWLGCKGPISYCQVPRDKFAGRLGGCTTVGSPCIGCTEPGFPDEPFSPFFEMVPAKSLATGIVPGNPHQILDIARNQEHLFHMRERSI
jgi:hydrogenase small subunit